LSMKPWTRTCQASHHLWYLLQSLVQWVTVTCGGRGMHGWTSCMWPENIC
jgi:hypothetical protein